MINIPIDAKEIIKVLQDNKYKAYVVGGCVRDSILGKEPKDWDITTNAIPEKIIEIFNNYNVIPTGLKHGTVTIMINSIPYEVTTFRTDGVYSDGRHPDSVEFTNDLIKDLSRRDFTINSLAYNNEEGILDYFGGIKDLQDKLIRCVGNPEDRFSEDALRMARACRFSSQLNFKLDQSVINSILKNSKLIQNISKERIQSELNKILLSENLNGLYHFYQSGLLQYVIPIFESCFLCNQSNPYHIYNVGLHIFKSVEFIEMELHLKLTMLFHDVAKPICKTLDENGIGHFYGHAEESSKMAIEILGRMKYDNLTITRVRDLIFYHDSEIQDSRKSIRKWLNKIGEETFRNLLKVRKADIKAQNTDYYQERHDKLERIKVVLEEVLNAKECFSKKDLAINGTDLIKLGYTEGKQIGEIINKLVELVLDNPNLNTKEQLVEIVKTL